MAHTRECFAKALICAVENVRDAESHAPYADMASFDYAAEATRYLDEGLLTCRCPGKVTEIDAEPCGDMTYYVRLSQDLDILAGPFETPELARPWAERFAARGHDVDLVSGAYV